MSHTSPERMRTLVRAIRSIEEAHGRPMKIYFDTWGPGHFVSLASESGVFCAVSIRGGTIRAADSEDGRFHWSRDTVYDAGPQSRFNAKDMLLVGV